LKSSLRCNKGVALSTDKVTIKIPRPLYEKLQTIIEETGFRSVNAFIVHVLRDLVALRGGDQNGLTPQEVGLVRDRLRKLGYL
jgi:metal-responsive CopG/Arc/MetJ family transcriptional regulator